MANKNKKFFIVFIIMNLIYIVFVLGTSILNTNKGETPVIQFDNDNIVVDVKDKENKLFDGVTATDKEDGDISSNIIIYSISPFDKNQNRTITYAVFDSDNHMVTASRMMKYSNYTPPKFDASNPLIYLTINELFGSAEDEVSYVNATSSVDGDISDKISVTTVEDGNDMIIKYSITDSTGTTSNLEVRERITLNNVLKNNIDIELKKYIVYVKKGAILAPSTFIKNVVTSLGKQNELKPYVVTETNYNPNVEGTYEVRYTLNRSNGDYGFTKLIVIVE